MDLDPSTLNRRDAYRLMISCIIPRPIAFVTTLAPNGKVNLAPFSYFNGVCSTPPIVSIAVGSKREGRKDTWRNIEDHPEFVVNVVTPALMDAVIIGAGEHPREVSELELAGLTPVPSTRVRVPRVKESPIHLECVRYAIHEVEGSALILGRVVHWHVDDAVLRDGAVDPKAVDFVGRLGDELYAHVREIFERRRS